MKTLQAIILMTSTITTGLVAGLMFTYACSVMPGLGRSSDRTLVEAMQNINRAILNPWFLFPFLGSLPLIVLAVVLALRGHGRPALPWILAGLALYLVAYLITQGINIPLNNQLDRAGDPARITDLTATRQRFEGKWVTWNIIRSLVHTAAFACLAWALVVYAPGGARTNAAAPATTHHAPAPPTAAGIR